MSKPRCPVCGRKGAPCGPDTFRCSMGHLFDDSPDEGGTFHNDPTKRLEKEDENRVARKVNAEGRGRAAQGYRMPR